MKRFLEKRIRGMVGIGRNSYYPIKRLFFIGFLLLTLTFSLVYIPSANAQPPEFSVIQVFWGSQTEKVQAKPGDQNLPLNVVIQNIDNVEMTSVKAKLILQGSPFTTPTGEKEAYAGVLSLLPGQQATLTFILNIDKNAKLGVYKLEMEVTSITKRYSTGVSSSTTIFVPVYGEVFFSTFLSPKKIFPGSNTLTLTIQNEGEAKASNLDVLVNIPSPLIIMGEDNSWSFDEVKPNQNLTVTIDVYAPVASVGGAYPITVTVSYVDAYGFSHVDQKTLGLAVENPLKKPLLKIRVDNGEIVSGEKSILNITLTNNGEVNILNLDVTLSLPKPVASLGGTSSSSPLILLNEDNFWHFDKIKPKESVLIPVLLTTDKGVVGTYQISLTLTYQDERNQTYRETRSVGLTVSPKVPSSLVNIESYKVNPQTVYQGDVFTLDFNLKNFGDFKAQMVTVTLTPPTLFATLSPSTVSLGDIKPNTSKQVSFKVMASPSVKAGVVHVFRIDISYIDSKGIKQVTTNTLGVPIHGKIEFTIYDFSILPSPAHIGSEFTVSFTLLNHGTSPAMYTNVSIIPSKTFQLTKESSSYVGQVDPNAPAPISLTSIVSSDVEEGNYPLKILVVYKDEYNQPHSFTYETSVKVVTPPTPPKTSQTTVTTLIFESLLIPAIVIVVLIMLAATILIRRKLKSSKEKP